MPHVTPTDTSVNGRAYVPVYNLVEYGADNSGVRDCRSFLVTAAQAAAAARGKLWVPPGTYKIERDGSNSWLLDWPSSNVEIEGVYGQSIFQAPASLPGSSISIVRCNGLSNITFRGITFDGNWGNAVTKIEAGSHRQALPQGTLYVEDTSDFPTTGTLYIVMRNWSIQTITYTGKTATTFTGCSGGTGTMMRGLLVGRSQTIAGLNHSDQDDPKSHGLMIRGCSNIRVENCIFRDLYGDGVWIGLPSDDDLYQASKNISIRDSVFSVTARNGVTFGAAPIEDVTIDGCTFEHIFTSPIDAEPIGLWGGVRDVVINDNTIRGWWTGANPLFLVSVVSGWPSGYNQTAAARGWRITSNTIYGTCYVDNAIDVTIAHNRFICDFPSLSASYIAAPILVDHACDDISIVDNYVYDNQPVSTGSAAGYHWGSIQVAFYGSGNVNLQPAGVRVIGNRVHARNGTHGIRILAQGGFSTGDETPVVAAASGTSTGVTANSLTKTGAGWTTNQWIGWRVITGGVEALIKSNTSEVLTLEMAHDSLIPYAWRTPLGDEAVTPSTGTFWITSQDGVCVVEGNDVDCGYDGNSAGGNGVYLFNDRAGSRISVARNNIKNATSYGVMVVGNANKPPLLVEFVDNKFWDNQPAATMSACIRFNDAAALTGISKLIMRGNAPCGGLSTVLSLGGGASGKWLLHDGDVQAWAGYGVPNHSAPQGSTYINKSGTGADSLYVNTDGGTTWSAR